MLLYVNRLPLRAGQELGPVKRPDFLHGIGAPLVPTPSAVFGMSPIPFLLILAPAEPVRLQPFLVGLGFASYPNPGAAQFGSQIQMDEKVHDIVDSSGVSVVLRVLPVLSAAARVFWSFLSISKSLSCSLLISFLIRSVIKKFARQLPRKLDKLKYSQLFIFLNFKSSKSCRRNNIHKRFNGGFAVWIL